MDKIVIYVDEGVAGNTLRHLVKSVLKEVGDDRYLLKRMDAHAIKSQDWEEETALFVIPGGRDLIFHEKLGPEGAARIRSYVENGGNYLGICAGAYFGAAEIEFERGGLLEVCGKRHLAFYPGMAKGSVYGVNKYRADSQHGAEAALINWKNATHTYSYFNGGCSFVNPSQHPSVKVLGLYSE